ncbi:MAG: ABC transporter permease [Bryobacteraceae bacterium]
MRPFFNLLRNLVRKQQVETHLDAELRSYLDLLEQEKIQSGLDPATARREALLEVGGIEQVKESVRDVRAGRWLHPFSSDLRHAWRMILKMPLMAAVVIGSLGVGIGVNAAVFSWIQAVVFQPLPGVSGSGSFHHVELRADTGSYTGASFPEFRDLRERTSAFQDLLAFRMVPFYVGETGRTERIYGLLVSGNYFAALGLQPALGRFIQPGEVSRPGADPVVVISNEYWQTRYGASPTVLGQTVRINDRPLTIIGVTPPRFQGTVLGMNFTFWTPATLAPLLLAGSKEVEDRSLRGYSMMAKLRPEASRASAEADLNEALRQLAQAYPETNAGVRGEVIPFWLAPRGPQRMLASSLALMQAIMILLLLAVCGNVANLMLARTSTRQREIGVRLAIGAGPGRVVSLLLTENLLLALFGAVLGVAIGVWATEALRAVPMIGTFPIRFQTRMDLAGLAFAMLLGLACGLLFGMPPAIALSRLDPQSVLRGASGTAFRGRLRNLLMGTQVALALVVLIVAGLFLRSFQETQNADPGFRREGILLAGYDLTGRNMDGAATRLFAGRLLERLRALPSVEGAAIATSVPLDIHGMPATSFTVEGHVQPNASPDQTLTNTVTAGYFATMGIPFHAGRDFTELNDAAAPVQAIVNDEFVRRYLQNTEPIGRRVTARGRAYTITGVVRNSVYESFGERTAPMLYRSYRDRPAGIGDIYIRTRSGTEMLATSDLRRIMNTLDPTLVVFDVRTMNEHVEKSAILRRIPARMFLFLGPLLLALAAIGIYAVVAYSVAQRTTEIGVRLALGASTRRVVSQIMGETLRVVGAGALAGWLVAFIVDLHLAHGMIYLPVFLGVPAILLSVAALACWVPAYRAGRIDPMAALRQE